MTFPLSYPLENHMVHYTQKYRPPAALAALLFTAALGQAPVGPHPSVHATVAGIVDRFR